MVRLDKFLANAGCGTRSEVKQLLKKGLVTINGEAAKKPEQKVEPDKDEVICQGQQINREEFVYYMLNKPAGYLSATEDRHQPVVLDLLHETKKDEVFPVGRLDIDTEGLLLLTNDGVLAHELLSPKKHVDKTYYAVIQGLVTEEDCQRFAEGLEIGEKKKTMPAKLVILPAKKGAAGDGLEEASECSDEKKPELSYIEVTIQEGKFHQVKRMFEAVGKKVVYLKRISMGSLILDPDLEKGTYRRLTISEIEGLKNNAGK